MFTLTVNNIKSYKCPNYNTMGLEFIKMQVVGRRKPIIYNYQYDTERSHIVVIDNVEYTHSPISNNRRIPLDKEQTAFFRIKDPWPKCEGNEYFSTYERYYIQDRVCNNPKYTIHASNPISDKCENSALTLSDNAYLNNILTSAEPETLVIKFLNNTKNRIRLETNRLSGDFYRITNLPNSRASFESVGIGLIFDIFSVGGSSFSSMGSGMDASISISTILNHNYCDKIVCLNVEKTIITAVSISKTKKCNPNSTLPAPLPVNQWILYQIEHGKKYDEFFKDLANLQDSNYKIVGGNEGMIIRFADANFIVFTIKDKYYVYDLYGNGFNNLGKKVQQGKIIDFDEFLALAKIYKPK
jgi:hypothetical protein